MSYSSALALRAFCTRLLHLSSVGLSVVPSQTPSAVAEAECKPGLRPRRVSEFDFDASREAVGCFAWTGPAIRTDGVVLSFLCALLLIFPACLPVCLYLYADCVLLPHVCTGSQSRHTSHRRCHHHHHHQHATPGERKLPGQRKSRDPL